MTITQNEMPEMPEDELQRWLASREEAGRVIDIETCELDLCSVQTLDPYGVRDLPPEMRQVGAIHFVRSPTSNGWISQYDLPVEKMKALHDRIARDRETYPYGHPDDLLWLTDFE